jgi:hemolysin-activating ACP:hemolysin acyltransferase
VEFDMQLTAEQNRLIHDTLHLMSLSEYHRTYSDDGIRRLILAPLQHNKLLVQYDAKDDPIAFCTYAFLTPEAEDGYINKTRKIQPMDFENEDGTLWCIDFAAPFGNCRGIIREMRTFFEETYGEGTRARIFRQKQNRFGWMIA